MLGPPALLVGINVGNTNGPLVSGGAAVSAVGSAAGLLGVGETLGARVMPTEGTVVV